MKVQLKKRSRKGNVRPFGVLIIQADPHQKMQTLYDMASKAKEMLNQASTTGTNCVLAFTGCTAKFIRLG